MQNKNIEKLNKGREKIKRMSGESLGRELGDVYKATLNYGDKQIQSIPIDKLVPAPSDWNFFPAIAEDKMLEMMMSIQENGLFNPIITWKQRDTYMILSGHNRVAAYKRILQEYGSLPDFNEKEYLSINAVVFDENEIDEIKAKEIIIDTNYIQRDEDKRLMPIIIKNRINITKKRKDKKGRTIDIVAKEMGISRTKIYEDHIIGTAILPELADMFFDGKLGKKALLKFAWYNKGVQKHIYDNFSENIVNENCLRIRKNMDREELEEIFSAPPEVEMAIVQFRVPESLKEAFKSMCNQWLEKQESQ